MADFSSLVQKSAQKWNVDPALINAVIQQESSGNPSAWNKSGGGQGAAGLMQVRAPALSDYNAANGTKYSMQDLLSPDVGADVGSWYLAQQLNKFNDPRKALSAYKEGAGSQEAQTGSSPYAQQVLGRLNMPQKQSQSVSLPGIPVMQHSAAQGADPFSSLAVDGQNNAPVTATAGNDPFSSLPVESKQSSQASSPQAAPQQTQANQPGSVMSFLAGVGRGVQETALGAQQLIGHGMQALGSIGESPNLTSVVTGQQPMNMIGRAGQWLVNDANQGLQRGAQETAPYQAAHPTITGAGTLAGSIAATAPLGGMVGAGGSLLGMAGRGALSGALGAAIATPVDPTDPNYWAAKAKQTALGAATGGIAGPVIGGISRAISPNVAPDVQRLMDAGVTPTPGQILGGGFARTESKLESVPFLGDLIKNAKARAVGQFNEAAYNQALAPIGQTFDPTAAKVGQEGIAQVKGKIQDVYNSVLPQMQFRPDQQFQNEMINLGQLASALPKAQQETFMSVLKSQFGKMGPQGQMDGQTLKGVAEEIGDKASGYLGDGSYDNRQLGAALSALKGSFMDAVKRASSPDLAQQLSNADAAWANFARIRSAGASIGAANNEGIFTAAQLQNAVKAGDKSAGKGAFATGGALMQDLSSAGQSVLGSKYPDSGTAGRGLMALLAPGGVAAGLATAPGSTLATLGGIGLGSLPYTSLGQRATAALLTSRPQFAAPVGNLVGRLGPVIIPGGTAALLSNGGSVP